jgi:hypothetical protein
LKKGTENNARKYFNQVPRLQPSDARSRPAADGDVFLYSEKVKIGGNISFYKKYLKYKNKYLLTKKKL